MPLGNLQPLCADLFRLHRLCCVNKSSYSCSGQSDQTWKVEFWSSLVWDSIWKLDHLNQEQGILVKGKLISGMKN